MPDEDWREGCPDCAPLREELATLRAQMRETVVTYEAVLREEIEKRRAHLDPMDAYTPPAEIVDDTDYVRRLHVTRGEWYLLDPSLAEAIDRAEIDEVHEISAIRYSDGARCIIKARHVRTPELGRTEL
jgi:hypothetical protein